MYWTRLVLLVRHAAVFIVLDSCSQEYKMYLLVHVSKSKRLLTGNITSLKSEQCDWLRIWLTVSWPVVVEHRRPLDTDASESEDRPLLSCSSSLLPLSRRQHLKLTKNRNSSTCSYPTFTAFHTARMHQFSMFSFQELHICVMINFQYFKQWIKNTSWY